jgi:hypothetical protein
MSGLEKLARVLRFSIKIGFMVKGPVKEYGWKRRKAKIDTRNKRLEAKME